MREDAPDPSALLLRRWQSAGDREALEALLIVEVEALKVHLRRRGRGPAAGVSVSDVAQDVAMRVLRLDPAPHFDNPKAMRAYLWTAAQRLLLDHLKCRGAADVSIESQKSDALGRALETTGGLGAVESQDHAAALDVALGLLEPEERRMLERFYFEHEDPADIAAELGISAPAARMRIARARMSLARKLVKWTSLID